MTADDLFETQRTWASRGLSALRELLPLMSPVGRVKDWTPEEQGTLGELLAASARSSESVLLLCAYGQLWDADVISRSVVEGSLKFIYLMQSREHFKQRYQEYANDMFQIGLFKDHKRAETLLAVLPDPDAAQWQPFRDLLLTPSELDSTNKRYGRVKRRELESRWGYMGLIGEISRAGDAFAGAMGTAHAYSMSSHIAHADAIGVGIAIEHDFRSPERRELAHLAHLSRLISDQLTYLHLRLLQGYRFVGEPLGPLDAVTKKLDELHSCFGNVYERWMAVEYGRG